MEWEMDETEKIECAWCGELMEEGDVAHESDSGEKYCCRLCAQADSDYKRYGR